ncbi:cytochrome P450 [Dichotomocladium elegans]|nr:cytochrome P450 [Dichotomocladium elegans]
MGTIVFTAITWMLSHIISGVMWRNKYQDGRHKPAWPQSPKGLPLIWNGYEMFKADFYRAFTRWGKELGDAPIFSVKLMQKRVIVLNHAGVVRAALLDQEQKNSSRAQPSLVDGVEFVFGDQGKTVFTAAFSLYWGRLRRAIVKVIGKMSVNQFDGVFKRQAALFSKDLKGSVDADDLRKKVDLLAMEATLTMVFGKQEFAPAGLRTLIDVCHASQALQESRWYHRYGSFVGIARSLGVILGGNSSTVALRDKALVVLLELKQQQEQQNMSIAKSLQKIDPSKNDPEPVQLTPDEIIINLLHLVMHGYQYLSSALFTVIQRLATLPEYQERLFQSSDDDNGENGRRALANAIVAESLRFNPPARIYTHTSRQEQELEWNGTLYRIDDGTDLVINLDKIHFDEQFYAKPGNFNPDRFFSAKRSSILDLKGKANDHLAFGVGRRVCLGSHASQQMLATTILALIRQYKLKGGSVDQSVDHPSSVWAWTGRTDIKGAPVEFVPRV